MGRGKGSERGEVGMRVRREERRKGQATRGEEEKGVGEEKKYIEAKTKEIIK